jgi:hypothetical protein
MESELPIPIDDSIPFPSHQTEEVEQPRFYREPEPMYYYNPPPQLPPIEQNLKKVDIFSELGKTHWILFISAVLLAFFMGKSIATPIIIRST